MDPITLEVLSEGLISVVREMRATVFRTARSVAIYEAKDFSCGLFDPDTQVVAQSEDIGAHVVPLPWSVKFAMEDFAGDLAPGDVIVLNDPYRGGTHLNDVTLIYPVFAGGKLVFFPAVREHWADVGGAVPGSLSGTATEIYQEGVRIPPIKLVERGTINRAAMDLILSNMRVPDERLGDFHAGMAACHTAEKRINELVARYGTEALLDCVRINLDRSEARMRAQIARLPDGEFHYEDYLETFSDQGFDPLLLPLKLSIRGDRLTADFTGASPQVPVPVNSTLAVTAASVFITLKSALDPTAPLNHGSFRPVEVIAPEGTIVNVRHPAPAGSHGEIRKRVVATMLGALSQIVPELISGDIHRTSFHNLIGGIHPRTGKEYVHYEWSSGGNGAFAEDDGASAMATIDWGDLTTVQPSEVLETRFPLVVDWSRLGIGFRRRRCAPRRPRHAPRAAARGRRRDLFAVVRRRDRAAVRRHRWRVGGPGRLVRAARRPRNPLRPPRQGRRVPSAAGRHGDPAVSRRRRVRRPAGPPRRPRRRRRPRGLCQRDPRARDVRRGARAGRHGRCRRDRSIAGADKGGAGPFARHRDIPIRHSQPIATAGTGSARSTRPTRPRWGSPSATSSSSSGREGRPCGHGAASTRRSSAARHRSTRSGKASSAAKAERRCICGRCGAARLRSEARTRRLLPAAMLC